MKIRSTSSNAMVLGCRCPTIFFLEGSVTSITSCFIRSSRIARSIFALLSSKILSIASRVSLTSCPTLGRSSGATFFIPFKTAVSSPFLPKNFTRTSFNFSGMSAALIAFNASSLMLCNFSFIAILPFLLIYKLVPGNAADNQKKPIPKRDELLPVVPP